MLADELLRRGGRIVPVAQEHHRIRRPDGDVAELAGRQHAAVVADDLHLVAERRLADPAGRRVEQRRAGRHDHVAFGLAIELVQGQAEFAPSPFQQFLAERLAAARRRAQRERPARARRRHQPQHPQRGRRQEGAGHLVARHQVEGRLGVELGEAAGEHRDAVMPGRQQHVEQAADPGPVGRRPDEVAFLRKRAVRHLDAGQVPEQHAVRMQDPLGLAGGAGGVDDDRRIVGGGVDRLEVVRLRCHRMLQRQDGGPRRRRAGRSAAGRGRAVRRRAGRGCAGRGRAVDAVDALECRQLRRAAAAPWRGRRASVTRILAPESARRYCSASGPNSVNSGTATAPDL